MNARNEIAATLLLLCGLNLVLALTAAPVETVPEQPDLATTKRDGQILADCMNGRRISLGDGQVTTCRITRM